MTAHISSLTKSYRIITTLYCCVLTNSYVQDSCCTRVSPLSDRNIIKPSNINTRISTYVQIIYATRLTIIANNLRLPLACITTNRDRVICSVRITSNSNTMNTDCFRPTTTIITILTPIFIWGNSRTSRYGTS